jgi:formylglycine-generating enzyme required for sulfatase activity
MLTLKSRLKPLLALLFFAPAAAAAGSDEPPPPIDAPPAGFAETAKARPPGAPACPAGMKEVEGDYCPEMEQKCLKWQTAEKFRCVEFAPSGPCKKPTSHRHFCMDEYEYPNQAGATPVVMKSWYDAKAACQAQGKRLCKDGEWTLACEGAERLPYPYGYKRDATACNIDHDHILPNEKALSSRDPATRDAEVKRLWRGEASGTRPRCVSPFGVHDMTGNVDEWVVNEKGHPHQSGLKGGYWSRVRGRCRPMTDGHDEFFVYYQIGFRCCADVN